MHLHRPGTPSLDGGSRISPLRGRELGLAPSRSAAAKPAHPLKHVCFRSQPRCLMAPLSPWGCGQRVGAPGRWVLHFKISASFFIAACACLARARACFLQTAVLSPESTLVCPDSLGVGVASIPAGMTVSVLCRLRINPVFSPRVWTSRCIGAMVVSSHVPYLVRVA